jgi:uncharacterized protein YcbX
MMIEGLYFYPIKSFRGLQVSELELLPQGPRFDRQFMLVDENNKFITQRTQPELARIALRLSANQSIELSLPELGSVRFSVEDRLGRELPVVIFKDTVPAYEVRTEVSAWCSEALKCSVRLVRISEHAQRKFADAFLDRTVRFVDSQPLLVLSTASIKELSQRLGYEVPVSRFRPNILVDGVPAHAEDDWRGFRSAEISFKRTKACGRCKLTTVDPETGAVGDEPFKTLSSYRRTEKGVLFGSYYAHLNEGRLHQGEVLTAD